MEPRVIRREKKLHLSYELPHRIHCSRIYPLQAPNGSTVILYGHDRGLRVVWRGGRRRMELPLQSSKSKPNGTRSRSPEVIVIDDDDDDDVHDLPRTDAEGGEEQDMFEDAEDEQDPDCPYPGIIRDINIELGPTTEILRVAVPSLSALSTGDLPTLARKNAIVALTCSDGRVVVLTVPLTPPTSSEKHDYRESTTVLEGDGKFVNDLAIKLMAPYEGQPTLARTRSQQQRSGPEGRLLVAATTDSLTMWHLDVMEDTLAIPPKSVTPMPLPGLLKSSVSFHPSGRSTVLLLADRPGVVRIFDFYPSDDTTDSNLVGAGRVTMTYHTPFNNPKDNPAVARRKKVLDAKWMLGSRAIFALLEDGAWGVWDLTGSTQNGKAVEDFALQGFVDSASATEIDSGKQKKTASKLAPMTPNTRKTKSENLFKGSSKAPGVAPTGGISVASTSNPRSGQIDESVVLWYNNDVYSIPSFQTFWQRSTSGGGGGFGSLHAPGMTHVSDIKLMNENVTSISQFKPPRSTASANGQMNSHRDLLVSAEHRFTILQTLRSATPAPGLFQDAAERPAARDQRMLDAGNLDLGGLDRMIDSLSGDRRLKRVGFAQ